MERCTNSMVILRLFTQMSRFLVDNDCLLRGMGRNLDNIAGNNADMCKVVGGPTVKRSRLQI